MAREKKKRWRRKKRRRRAAAGLLAQKELMFSHSGRWFDVQKADGEFSVLGYEHSPSLLLCKTNECGEMPVSWRNDLMQHVLCDVCP